MGEVELRFDERLGRPVALKVANSPAGETALVREARLTARLDHPGIVPIHDAGRLPDGRAYYTMPVLPGHTLAEATDDATRVRHVLDASRAVAHAHAHGVLHWDLKPENLLVGAQGEYPRRGLGPCLRARRGTVHARPVLWNGPFQQPRAVPGRGADGGQRCLQPGPHAGARARGALARAGRRHPPSDRRALRGPVRRRRAAGGRPAGLVRGAPCRGARLLARGAAATDTARLPTAGDHRCPRGPGRRRRGRRLDEARRRGAGPGPARGRGLVRLAAGVGRRRPARRRHAVEPSCCRPPPSVTRSGCRRAGCARRPRPDRPWRRPVARPRPALGRTGPR
ncbi:MAG: hypothetical protein GY913_04645 [Proteobacteria bacterium]|nr:hypothetical protein [Pseudomonadota bacterium]